MFSFHCFEDIVSLSFGFYNYKSWRKNCFLFYHYSFPCHVFYLFLPCRLFVSWLEQFECDEARNMHMCVCLYVCVCLCVVCVILILPDGLNFLNLWFGASYSRKKNHEWLLQLRSLSCSVSFPRLHLHVY
jgi:hypothetical protein